MKQRSRFNDDHNNIECSCFMMWRWSLLGVIMQSRSNCSTDVMHLYIVNLYNTRRRLITLRGKGRIMSVSHTAPGFFSSSWTFSVRYSVHCSSIAISRIIYLFTHPFIHHRTHPSIHLLICSKIQKTLQPSIHPNTQSSIHLPIHPFFYSSIQWSTKLFFHSSPNHSSLHLSILPSIHCSLSHPSIRISFIHSQSIHLPSTHSFIHPSPILSSIHPPLICPFIHPFMQSHTHTSIYLPIHPSIHWAICYHSSYSSIHTASIHPPLFN